MGIGRGGWPALGSHDATPGGCGAKPGSGGAALGREDTKPSGGGGVAPGGGGGDDAAGACGIVVRFLGAPFYLCLPSEEIGDGAARATVFKIRCG
jgi:hypothetical protein